VGPAAALGVGAALPIVAYRLAGPLDLPAWGAGAATALGAWIAGRWLAPTLGGVRLGLLAAAAVTLGAWL
jgi:hypothetical protein